MANAFPLGFGLPAGVDIRAPLSGAAATLRDAQAAIRGSITARLAQAQAVHGQFGGQVYQHVASALASAEGVVGHAHDAIETGITARLARAYETHALADVALPGDSGPASPDAGSPAPAGPTYLYRLIRRQSDGQCQCQSLREAIPDGWTELRRYVTRGECFDAQNVCNNEANQPPAGLPPAVGFPPQKGRIPTLPLPPPPTVPPGPGERVFLPPSGGAAPDGGSTSQPYAIAYGAGQYPQPGGVTHEGPSPLFSPAGTPEPVSVTVPDPDTLYSVYRMHSGYLQGRCVISRADEPPPADDAELILGGVGYGRAGEARYECDRQSDGQATTPMVSDQAGAVSPTPPIGTPPVALAGCEHLPESTTDWGGLNGVGGTAWTYAPTADGGIRAIVPAGDGRPQNIAITIPSGGGTPDPTIRGTGHVCWRGSVAYEVDPATGAITGTGPQFYGCQPANLSESAPHPCRFQMPSAAAAPIGTPDCLRVEICNWPSNVSIGSINGKPAVAPTPPAPSTSPPTPAVPSGVNLKWNPCDPLWCSALASDLAQFAEFGRWLKTIQDTRPEQFRELAGQVSNAGSFLGYVISSLLSFLVDVGAEAFRLIFGRAVQAALNIASELGAGDVDAVIGLATARALLRTFHSSAGLSVPFSIEISVDFDVTPLIEQIDQLMRFASPTRVPEWPEIIELYRRGKVTIEHAKCLARFHGRDEGCVDLLLAVVKERLTVDEVIEYARRNEKDDDWINTQLRELGYTDDEVRDQRKYLYDEIPPVTDLLHFAQVNATDETNIKTFGLADEFERFWKEPLQVGLQAQGISEDWAKVYWQAHWVRASVEQAQQALRRLRSGRVPEDVVFTQNHFDAVMRENDILPFWRERFRLLAYQPPGIRFIRQLYSLNTWDKDHVIEGLQDISYSPEDAASLADTLETQKLRDEQTQAHGYSIGAVLKLYRDGAWTESQVRDELTGQKYTAEQIDASVAVATEAIAAEYRKKLIEVTHHRFLMGLIDVQELDGALSDAGLDLHRITQFHDLWILERELHIHKGSISELSKWAKEGLIDEQELLDRLTRLGVRPDDQQRIVASIASELSAIATRADLARQKVAEAEQRRSEADVTRRTRTEQARAKRSAKARLKVQKAVETIAEKEAVAASSDPEEQRRLKEELQLRQAVEAAEVEDLPPP